MAMEVVDQDEILFADINKQISLLIMDDDDDADHLPYAPATYQVVYSQVVNPITQPTQGFNYEQSKGTGVFIPRSTHRRRRSKQGRSNTDYNAATTKNTVRYSQNNPKGLLLPQHQLASNNYTSYSSFNLKRI